MRIAALTILTMAAVGAASPARAQTYNPKYPVCMETFDGFRTFICAYTSLEQCRSSASGLGAVCVINPYPAGSYAPAKRGRGFGRAD
jgi:hypothetical protein